MSFISKKFNQKINDLRDSFENNKYVTHNGIKGGLNENELRQIILQVIPSKYKITRGVIQNSNGDQSNETDLIIYDDEIIPPFIKDEISFVPVEAVKYIIESKSTLNSTEIKTTIEKFNNHKKIGYTSPTIIFSFSSDATLNELLRYKKYDENFFTSPAATVLCISGKGYYFKETKDFFLKDFISAEQFIKESPQLSDLTNKLTIFEHVLDSIKIDSMKMDEAHLLINAKNQIEEAKKLKGKKLTINSIEYEKIKFSMHRWVGIDCTTNAAELSLLSGISNTLCKTGIGKYLIDEKSIEKKVYSLCFQDMWGKISYEKFNENGIIYDFKDIKIKVAIHDDCNTQENSIDIYFPY